MAPPAPVTQQRSELDFEDVLAKFEANFSSDVRRGVSTAARIDTEVKDKLLSPTDVKTFEPDLRILWEELISHILRTKNKVPRSSHADTPDLSTMFIASGISREVFRNEIRSVLTKIRNQKAWDTSSSSDLSISEQASLRSANRLLQERTEELEALKRKYKQIDTAKHHLEHAVARLDNSVQESKKLQTSFEEEVDNLREQNGDLKKKCSDLEASSNRFGSERARFQSTIARYREELMLASHQAETAQLEATQAKTHAREVDRRATEAKASSAAVQVRIKELSEVQDAMIELMKGVKETGGTTPTTQRNLAALGEKRSRLVGRIANLLTRNRSGNPSSAAAAGSPASVSKGQNTDSNSVRHATGTGETFGNAQDNTLSSGEAGVSDNSNRNPFLDGIRKIGSELSRVGTNRSTKKSLMANVEKSRLAIENDAALREVIEIKEHELERMEDALCEAREKMASLELSLQQERHKRRTENRNTNQRGDSAEANQLLVSSSKTLFEWRSGTSDEITPTGVRRIDKTETATVHETEDVIGIGTA